MVARHHIGREVGLRIARIHKALDQPVLQIGQPAGLDIGEQGEVLHDQLIRNFHELPEHLIRRLVDADVVAQRLGHLLRAVGAFQQRHREHRLRLQPVRVEQLAAH